METEPTLRGKSSFNKKKLIANPTTLIIFCGRIKDDETVSGVVS